MTDIFCFGIAKDIVDQDIHQIAIDGLSVGDFRGILNTKYPAFTELKGYMIAVNQVYAKDDVIMTAGDEIAIIPPVSGG